jgi:DNA repair protein RecO
VKARLKDEAILLRIIPYSDNSLILKAFARQQGLISLLTKGIRKKAEGSLLSPLNIYEFNFYGPGESELCLLTDISLLRETQLSHKIEAWTAALCATELYSQLIMPMDENPAWFSLLSEYLDYLEKTGGRAILIWWRFLLRVFKMLGTPLEPGVCTLCQTVGSDTMFWDKASASILCGECLGFAQNPARYEKLSPKAAQIMALLPRIGLHLDELKPDGESVAQLNSIFSQHYQAHFHKNLRLKSLGVLEQFYG